MSLIFGGATSDRSSVPAAASLNNLDPLSVLFGVYPTALTNNRCLIAKRDIIGNTGGWHLIMSGTGGAIAFARKRATTATTLTSSSTPLAINGWYFILISFDSTATPPIHVYVTAANGYTLTEVTGTPVNGSGALSDDSGQALRFGNDSAASPTLALPGREGPVAIFNAVLSVANAQSWIRIPRKQVGAAAAAGFWRLGNEGTGNQQDYSGNTNTGTVTGATQALNGPPVGSLHYHNGLWRMAA